MKHLDDCNVMYNSGSTQSHGRPHAEDSKRLGLEGHPSEGHTMTRERHSHGDMVGRERHGAGGLIAGQLAAPFLEKIPHVGDALGLASRALGGFLPFANGGSVPVNSGNRTYAGNPSMDGYFDSDMQHGNMGAGGNGPRSTSAMDPVYRNIYKKGGHVSQKVEDDRDQKAQLMQHRKGGKINYEKEEDKAIHRLMRIQKMEKMQPKKKAMGGQIHNNIEGEKPYMNDGQMDGIAKRKENPTSIANGIPGRKPHPFKSGCKVKRK